VDSLHRGCVIDSPPVLCDSIHTITCGSMEDLHPFGRAENIAPTRRSSISFKDTSFWGCDGCWYANICCHHCENFQSLLHLQWLHAMRVVHMYDVLLYRFTNQQNLINYAHSCFPKKTESFESVTVEVMKNTCQNLSFLGCCAMLTGKQATY